MVMLVESGFAQQTEVAQAFGRSERSVRRYQERYGQAGMSGLGRPGGWRRGRRRISGKRLRLIERLKSVGLSNRAIAQRLGVSEMAIRKQVGPSKDEAEQLALVSVPKVSLIEPLPIPPSPMTAAGSFADQARAAKESEPELGALEEEAEEDEPVPMSLDPEACDRTLTDSSPIWGCSTMRRRCLVMASGSPASGYCWRCRTWCRAGCCASRASSTAELGRLSMGCERRC
jgi:transposase